MAWANSMTIVDWAIVIIMVIAVLGGMSQGFFRSFCSLAGLVLGLAVAAWNYGHVAALLLPVVRIRAVADTIAFLLLALLIMAVAAFLGSFLARAFARSDWAAWMDLPERSLGFSGRNSGHIGHHRDCGLLSPGTRPDGGPFAQAVFRRLPPEYPRNAA